MYVLPIRELLQTDGPPRAHQLLLQEGKVVVWQRGRICIFLSHQWLCYEHPDPEGRQMQVVRRALKSLLSGDLIVEVDSQVEAMSAKSDLPRWDFDDSARVHEALVWYDYSSIPQLFLEAPSLDSIAQKTSQWTSAASGIYLSLF